MNEYYSSQSFTVVRFNTVIIITVVLRIGNVPAHIDMQIDDHRTVTARNLIILFDFPATCDDDRLIHPDEILRSCAGRRFMARVYLVRFCYTYALTDLSSSASSIFSSNCSSRVSPRLPIELGIPGAGCSGSPTNVQCYSSPNIYPQQRNYVDRYFFNIHWSLMINLMLEWIFCLSQECFIYTIVDESLIRLEF